MSNRTVRVNELVQREISDILRKRYQTESVAITISEVRVSPDLRDARVFVAIVGDEATVEARFKWLRSKAAEIREHLRGSSQNIVSERERELFMESQHLGDKLRYNLPFTPAAGTPYPPKAGGQYGSTTCFPLPDKERFNNPNFP